MILTKLSRANLIHPPKWLINNTVYLTIMGSQAYGVSSDDSDCDIYGICIPPKEIVFPHLGGVIKDFGNQGEQFSQWSEHHIFDPNKKVEYDFSVYNIVKYFQLCMINNPNMIDSLFTPDNCVIHRTAVSDIIRANRKIFLHKGAWHKFKGYSYAQMGKIRAKTNSNNPKRAETILKYGYDVKFAYHVVRLINEVEQILTEGDLNLQRNNEQLKDIRRGTWNILDLEEYFKRKELDLEDLYHTSKLQNAPDENKIKELLMNCLEMHYGSISSTITNVAPDVKSMINDLQSLLDKYNT